MASPTLDRRMGLVGNVGWKAPVTVLAASNITLSGQQTIDGVAVLAINSAGVADRVLVTGQTDATQNGIWDVSTAAWTRSLDANGNYDLGTGSTVLVASGTTYGGTFWRLSTANPITIGTTAQVWARSLANSSSTVSFIQAGTGAVTRTVQDALRETVRAKDFGCVGDGVTDDTDNLILALGTGKVVDGGGLTYAVNGGINQFPAAFVGLQNIRLKQIDPTAASTRSIFITGNTNRFVMRNVTVDRGGSPGYTVGTNADYAGIYIASSSGFMLENVRVTNGGRGNGIAISSCDDWIATGCVVDEHYWQEVNPAVPVITDDIIQPFWINACSRFAMIGCRAKNCTSGSPGDWTTNVAASQYRKYTRWAFGGCHNFSVIGCSSYNLDQCFDFTGTVGNYDGTISACVAEVGGTHGFKFANSAYNLVVTGCVAKDIGRFAFVISGMSDPANPNVRNIDFVNCKAINTGSNGLWAGNCAGYRIMASALDPTYPRAIRFKGCVALDDQNVATMTHGFVSDVTAVGPTTAGYNTAIASYCLDCDVIGVTVAAQTYSGIGFPVAVLAGTNSGSATDSTWTAVDMDGTEVYDPAAQHSTSSSPASVYIKQAGVYWVSAQAQFNNNVTGTRKARIAVNGSGSKSPEYEYAPHPTAATTVTVPGVAVQCNVGDTVRLEIWQNSGGALSYDRAKASLSLARIQ